MFVLFVHCHSLFLSQSLITKRETAKRGHSHMSYLNKEMHDGVGVFSFPALHQLNFLWWHDWHKGKGLTGAEHIKHLQSKKKKKIYTIYTINRFGFMFFENILRNQIL